MRLSKVSLSVIVVKNCRANCSEVNSLTNCRGLVRLSAAVYTTARTSHNLDELYVNLACLNVVKKLFSVSCSACNSYVKSDITKLIGSKLDAICASYLVKLKRFERLALDNLSRCTESSLHNTACCAEDSACARTDIKRNVECFVIKLSELDTCLLDHSAEFSCCDSYVNVGNACGRLAVTSYLKLLCGTRNCGYEEDILRINSLFFSEVCLYNRAEHLLRRLTCRKVLSHFGIVVLTELDPSGRARSNHGKNSAILNSAEELCCLFHNCKVSGKVHVEHAIKAKALDSGNHLALNVCTGLVAEALADLCAYRGSCANVYLLRRICDSFHNLICIVSLVKSACGTSNDTLTAVDTSVVAKLCLERGSDMCVKSTVICADNADALNLSTSRYTTTAKDTLIVITDNGRGIIDLILIHFALEVVLVYTVLVAKLLKLAGCVTCAGKALLIVV